MTSLRSPLTALLPLVFLTPSAASLDNGALAHAVPLREIAVDGDLADWPLGLRRYAIQRSYFGNPPADPDDFQGEFRVAYNPEEGLLYLAVEITDESHIVGSEGLPWWDDDGCVIYFDQTHSPRGSGPIAYAATGTRRELSGNTGVPWDPVVAQGSWSNAQCSLQRRGNRTTYEWALQTGSPLAPGRSLGLDLVCVDLDEQDPPAGGSFLAWGKGTFKNRRAGRCGDVLLLGENGQVGSLHGEVRGNAEYEGPLPPCVRLINAQNSALWFDVEVDAEGHYQLEAPPGEYTIAPSRLVLESPGGIHRVSDVVMTRTVIALDSPRVAPALLLSEAPAPALFPEEGLLLDYTPERAPEIDRFVEAWMAHYGIPAVSLAIVHEGQLAYLRSFGVVNALTQEEVHDSTLFEAASITKAVFAYSVLRLVDRGVMDLDRPLYLDLPFPALMHDERHQQLTARIILTHRSGLPNWGEGDGQQIPFRFTPGTQYAYSGEAFQYLSRVVEKVDGRDMATILREECLEPMGIALTTCFQDSPELRRTASRGHRLAGPTRGNLPREIGVAHSMYTNAGALSGFMLGLLERRGLSPGIYEEMLAFHSERPGGEIAASEPWRKGMGLGFMVMQSPFGLIYGHDGNNGDFRSNFEVYPELNAGYILFVNHSLGGLLSDHLRTFLITGFVE